MAKYVYTALDASGQVRRGVIEAGGQDEAAARLRASGWRPLSLAPENGGRGFPAWRWRWRGRRSKVSSADIEFFTRQVGMLVAAGLGLDRALRVIRQHTGREALGELVGEIERKIKEGKSFSQALADYPEHFSSMYVNIVRAGEEGGILPAMLQKITDYQSASQELRQFIVSASIYPLFLLLVGFIAVVVLVTTILPRFEMLFEGMGRELPLNVRALMALARAISGHPAVSLLLAAAVPAGLYRYFRSQAGRTLWQRLSLKLPGVSGFIRDLETTRVFRTLEVLVENGVHLAVALRIASGVAGNPEFQRLLNRATSALKEGQRVGERLKEARLFPDLAADLLSIGEESGRVGAVCGQIADHYEESLRNRVKRMIAMIEPLFILVIALVAGYVVISMLSVILSINEIAV